MRVSCVATEKQTLHCNVSTIQHPNPLESTMNTPRHRPMNPRCLRLITLLLLLFSLPSAFATPTTPTSDFTDNQDGTVTHKTTGLTWMRCAMGQTWTGTTCSGSASTYTYAAAMALTSNFAGKSDWRLPNIVELQTLVERKNYNPTITRHYFLTRLAVGFGRLRPMLAIVASRGSSTSIMATAAAAARAAAAVFGSCAEDSGLLVLCLQPPPPAISPITTMAPLPINARG